MDGNFSSKSRSLSEDTALSSCISSSIYDVIIFILYYTFIFWIREAYNVGKLFTTANLIELLCIFYLIH